MAMTSRTESILEEALSLPETDRVRLGLRLLESASDDSEVELEPAWLEEIARRIRTIECGEAVFCDASDHLEKLRRKYNG